MVNKITNIKDRITYFIEYKEIKKGYFFENIGITSANFRGEAKKTPLNSTTIEKIITLYPELNVRWLLTGEGAMLNEENNEFTGLIEEPTTAQHLEGKIAALQERLIQEMDLNRQLQAIILNKSNPDRNQVDDQLDKLAELMNKLQNNYREKKM